MGKPLDSAVSLTQCVAGKRPLRPRKFVKHGFWSKDVLVSKSPWKKSSHNGLLPLIDEHL